MNPVGPANELPLVTVIAALSRPYRAAEVLSSFARQSYRGPKRLLVVENGDAVGSVAHLPAAERVEVISSAASSADARNAGLEWAASRGGGVWALLDDDDYYGPGYLEEQIVALLATGADVVGKGWQYVMYPDGLYRLHSDREYRWDDTGLTGGTLCGRESAGLPLFERRADDDIVWCSDVRRAGMRTWATSRYHYCYDRSGPGPRVQTAGPHVSRRALSGEGVGSDYFGLVHPSVVDDPSARPLRVAPPPTSAEILSDLPSCRLSDWGPI